MTEAADKREPIDRGEPVICKRADAELDKDIALTAFALGCVVGMLL